MYIKEYYPCNFFSKYIDSYFEIDNSKIHDDVKDLIIPDGTFGLLFVDGENIARNTTLNGTPEFLNKTTIFGQKTKPINYYLYGGNSKSFGVKIKPSGFHLFAGMVGKEFKNQFVEIDLLNSTVLNELEHKIFNAKSVKEKIKEVENYILSLLYKLELNYDYFLFESIVQYIYTNKGVLIYKNLPITFNVNYKKIERLFDKYLGITPKTYIRIVRFNAAINLYLKNQEESLTQIGFQLGFFDQAHFIRDFKLFTSLSPKKFFHRESTSSEKRYLHMLSQKWES